MGPLEVSCGSGSGTGTGTISVFVDLIVGFSVPSHEHLTSVDARGQVGALSSLSCSPVVFVVWQGTIIVMGEVVLFVCGCTATVGGSCHNI